MTHAKRKRPRVLVVAQRLPLPPRAGVDLRVLQTVTGLTQAAEVAVFGLEPGTPEPPAGVSIWRSSRDQAVADPAQTAAHVLKALSEPGGHPYDRYVTPGALEEVEALVEEFRPDAAVVEVLWLAGYVDLLARGGRPVVLSAHNVEAPLQRDVIASVERRLPPQLEARLIESYERFEGRAFSAVSQIWACSEADAELIRASYPGAAPVRVVPNCVHVDSYALPGEVATPPHTVVFPASFSYPPNAIAARWLAQELLPLLEERFQDAEVVLAGGQPTEEMNELARTTRGVTVTGAVPDMRPYLAAAGAMAVPVFQGGGTRFKVLEAFASSLPVVSTAKGVEGLAVRPDQHFLLAETPQGFADALAQLWTDTRTRAGIVQAGLELVRERYSWRAAAREMEGGLGELLASA
jgi:glycosyltransferase involved in cell wall biosynthesis